MVRESSSTRRKPRDLWRKPTRLCSLTHLQLSAKPLPEGIVKPVQVEHTASRFCFRIREETLRYISPVDPRCLFHVFPAERQIRTDVIHSSFGHPRRPSFVVVGVLVQAKRHIRHPPERQQRLPVMREIRPIRPCFLDRQPCASIFAICHLILSFVVCHLAMSLVVLSFVTCHLTLSSISPKTSCCCNHVTVCVS